MTAPDFANVDYKPGGSGNSYQKFDLYLPDATIYTKPSAGWPVVVLVNCTAFTASTKTGSLSGTAQHLVDRGIAVADATVSVKDAGIAGGGLFWSPEDAGWATADIAEKDALWIVQKLRDSASTYEIDTAKIGLLGEEWAAATIAQWVGCEKDHADSGATTTQEQKSSVPTSVFGVSGSWWNLALAGSVTQSHLRDATTTTVSAATYGDATTAHRQAFSPIYRASLAPSGGVASVQFWTHATGTGTQPLALSVDSSGLPARAGDQTSETDPWQSWMGIEWLRYHSGALRLHRVKSTGTIATDAQYRFSDRLIADAETAQHAAAFFAATLGAWYETVGTFSAPIKWAKTIEASRRGVTSLAVHAQRRQVALSASRSRLTASVRGWQVGHDEITAAELATLRALTQVSQTGAQPVEFDLPDAPGTAPVLIEGDSLKYELQGNDRYSYTVSVKEAI